MDKKMGLEDYVRLSFNAENPMKYVAQNEKRISHAVMLQIKLEIVSRPGSFSTALQRTMMLFNLPRRRWSTSMLLRQKTS